MHPDLKQNLIHYLKKESKKSNLSKQKKMDIQTMVGLSNRCLAKETAIPCTYKEVVVAVEPQGKISLGRLGARQ